MHILHLTKNLKLKFLKDSLFIFLFLWAVFITTYHIKAVQDDISAKKFPCNCITQLYMGGILKTSQLKVAVVEDNNHFWPLSYGGGGWEIKFTFFNGKSPHFAFYSKLYKITPSLTLGHYAQIPILLYYNLKNCL